MLGGILLLAFFLSSPADNTNAATDFDITVQPVLEVSLSPSLHLAFETDNILHSGSIDLNVLSNSRNGFTATVSTIYDSADVLGTSLTNTIDNNFRINTLTGSNIAAADFPANRWGYSVDGGTTFNAMPGVDEPAIILSTTSAAGSGNKSIYIGAKADTNTPSGTYENILLVTVVPKYVPINLRESFALAGKHRTAGVDGHNYYAMQDMTPAICDRSDELEDQTQVVDVRDQKIYWIAKLRDGNCWMTQNLNFDITENNVIPETSNVEAAWNSSSTYPPQATSTEVFTSTGDNDAYSYDPGDYYIEGGMGSSNIKPAECETGNGGVNCHYHLGNFYQWSAATAGTAGTNSNRDIAQSVCPKGWRMPAIDYNYGDKNLSFSKLTNAYGITNHANGISDTNLRASPLYFVRAGRVNVDENNVGVAEKIGNNGFYWSTMADESSYARAMVFWGSYVGPRDNYKRSYGQSIRCVAAGNDFTLIYDSNGGGSTPMIQKETSPSNAITMQISSVVPAGIDTFLGWANSSAATAPDYAYDSNTGTFTPSTITFTGPTITLYAVWQTVSDPHTYGYPIMQEVATWGQTLAEEVQVQALDARDGKLYWVAKLADGNIWMTQNLDFDIKGNNVVPETSDVEAAWNSGSAYPPQMTSAEIYNSSNKDDTYSYDPGSYYREGGAGGQDEIVANCTGNKNDGANCHYHLGNFYQWNAATAGSGGSTAVNQKAAYSICPKGWHLPIGNSYTENFSFGKLTNAYGITNNADGAGTKAQFLLAPTYGTVTGQIRGGNRVYVINDIDLWSSLSSANAAYVLYASNSTFRVMGMNNKANGLSVRCVTGVAGHEVTFSIYGDHTERGTISTSSITVPDGAAISVNYHDLSADITVGDTTVAATGNIAFEYTYEVDTVLHDSCGNNVFGDCDIVVVFNPSSTHTNMQQMTPSLCASIPVGTEGQLIDSRDNKPYWVAKLADGNCWMTQNLDFDITTNNVVPETSNVEAAWNSSSTYPPQSTSTTIFNSYGESDTYSYDPGDYYLSGGTGTKIAIDCSVVNGDENCHYHLGNLYQYNAATTGEGAIDEGWYYDRDSYSYKKEIEHSICPKGWVLPYDGGSYGSNRSFHNLFSAYGISLSSSATLLPQYPFYFVKSGYIYSGALESGGSSGAYWASVVGLDEDEDKKAYLLYFGGSVIELSNDVGTLYEGASVRCVAL